MSHTLRHAPAGFALFTAALVAQGLHAGDAWSAPAPTSVLVAGASLADDASLVSDNGRYQAIMQKSDGHLVVYDTTTRAAVWSAAVSGGSGATATMQADGNLVVYDSGKSAKWATGTNETTPLTYFLKLDGSGELRIYHGTPTSPGVAIWTSGAGRRYKDVAAVDIAKAFRPLLKFGKNTRCFAETFKQSDLATNYCQKSFDSKFVVFANVTRPTTGTVADTDGNTFRISYGVAFGWQQGTYTGVTHDIIAKVSNDAGDHGEDAQYMVVDVINGSVSAVWADLHTGYYARPRGQLDMVGDHVIAWVGEYYHPLKLVRETTSVCQQESDGTYGFSANVTNAGLRAACTASCVSSRSCMPTDTVLNWGDPSGETYEGYGQLAMVPGVCATDPAKKMSYTSPDGEKYAGEVYGMLQYIGCSYWPPSTPGTWENTLKSHDAFTNPYGLSACKNGVGSAGGICNASYVTTEGKPWITSSSTFNMYLEPTTAGSADVDYAAGGSFNDLPYILGKPRSITLRTGARIDSVSTTYTDGGIQGHGGTGGSAITMNGLDTDPIVRVELCSGKRNGRVRAGHIKLQTYTGVMKQGGNGYDGCHTIAPFGKMLYGFYGRSGDEVDLVGTYWGDLPSSLPAKQTSW